MIFKYIFNINEYPKYIKTINERWIKPRLFKLSKLSTNFKPNYKSPSNIFSYSVLDLENYDILSHKLNIFKKIDWYKDISSNKTWPKVNYQKIKVIYPDNSDIKYIWEIGRLQFLLPLGSIYKKTTDEKYAIKFKEIVTDFFTENPIKLGPNWKCTMDVGLRAINLIYAYSYFKDSKSISKDFWNNYFNELYKTGEFIYNNLEWAPIRGNHYLSDIVGLFYLGIVFKDAKLGNKWLNFAKKELESEINFQINIDGVDFEGSTSYQRLVAELFFYSYIFGKINQIKFSNNYICKLKKITEFIYAYTMNSGLAPQIGDNDNGMVIRLNNNRNINDHRYLLQLSDIYLKTKFNQKNIEPETIFFCGKIEVRKYKLSNILKSFSQGIDIYRDKDLFMCMKCGENGLLGKGGHNHNDQLSFVLEYKKQLLFVDPGTYSYTGHPKWRNYFRSSQNHNTISLFEKEDVNLNYGLFNLPSLSLNKTVTMHATKNGFSYIGKKEFNNSNIIVKRKIEYNNKFKEIIIKDNIFSNSQIKGQFCFVFAPNIMVKPKPKELELSQNNSKIKLLFDYNYTLKDGLYSDRYGFKEQTKQLIIIKDVTINKYIWKIQLL